MKEFFNHPPDAQVWQNPTLSTTMSIATISPPPVTMANIFGVPVFWKNVNPSGRGFSMRYILYLFAFLIMTPYLALHAEEENQRPFLVVLYGARGSGRATFAVRLRQDFSFPNISMAALIAHHLLEDTSLGKEIQEYIMSGREFPQELSLTILCDRLSQPDCSHGAFLEEIPLGVDQAQAIRKCLSSRFRFLAVNIEAGDDWIIQRVEHRLICRTCGRVYDEPYSQPKNKGSCDICSGPLQQRLEDSPEIIKTRLETYRNQIRPLFSFYENEQTLVQIPGEKNFEAIYQDIVTAIETHTGLVCSKQSSA